MVYTKTMITWFFSFISWEYFKGRRLGCPKSDPGRRTIDPCSETGFKSWIKLHQALMDIRQNGSDTHLIRSDILLQKKRVAPGFLAIGPV